MMRIDLFDKMRLIWSGGAGMRRRLMLYFFSLLAILLAAVFCFLQAAGLLWSVESRTESLLNAYLNEYTAKATEHFDGLAAQSIRFSKNLTALIESELAANDMDFKDLNDNPRTITDLENTAYELAEQALFRAAASGVFFILDVTSNTVIQDAEKHKSGLHIKIGSANSPNRIDPPLYMFRGSAETARKYDIIHHNHWNLEFNTDDYPFYARVKGEAGRDLFQNWYVSPVVDLPLTWDDAAFVAAPIYGARGEFYGVCGFEISKIYYMHSYMLHISEFNNAAMMLALREGDKLRSDTGLESGAYCRQSVSVSEGILITKLRGSLTSYSDGLDRFVGMGRSITLSPLDGADKWEIVVMASESEYNSKLLNQIVLIALLLILVVTVSVLASILLSMRYVQPITEGLALIRNGGGQGRSTIPEINDLLDFLAEQDAERERSGQPPEEASPLVSSYNDFLQKLEILTAAENEIFDLYLQGFTAKQISDIRSCSIATIRFHNRNIYAKLGISSREELMLIARMTQGMGIGSEA